MTTIRGLGSAAVTLARPGLNPADLKTAAKLKDGLNDLLARVRLGSPLPKNKMPTRGSDGAWKAPNGDRLFSVRLSTPPPGSADFPTGYALVNPKTNEFYKMQSGGFTGATFAHGPLALPAALHFKAKAFGPADFKQLEAAANGEGDKPGKLPTKGTIDAAFGAYTFHKMIKWVAKGPAEGAVLAKVPFRKDNHPDGFSYTGLVLKNDPTKVVIMKSGGFAGITQYSQPIDVTRIPK